MRVFLIHWKEVELEERSQRLREAGYVVVGEESDAPAAFRALKAEQPDVVVIDLGRLPSHGREIGSAIRDTKATRHVPIVFVDGADEKVKRVQQDLPDAVYSRWSGIREAIDQAIATAPQHPVVPTAHMERYAGSSLIKKLGIKTDSTVVLVDAPSNVNEIICQLPDGVKLRRRLQGRFDTVIWFVTSFNKLESRLDQISPRITDNSLWIAWPKKRSGVETDVTQGRIREIAFATGLVDYKVCSIDDIWSGLKFTRRKQK